MSTENYLAQCKYYDKDSKLYWSCQTIENVFNPLQWVHLISLATLFFTICIITHVSV